MVDAVWWISEFYLKNRILTEFQSLSSCKQWQSIGNRAFVDRNVVTTKFLTDFWNVLFVQPADAYVTVWSHLWFLTWQVAQQDHDLPLVSNDVSLSPGWFRLNISYLLRHCAGEPPALHVLNVFFFHHTWLKWSACHQKPDKDPFI